MKRNVHLSIIAIALIVSSLAYSADDANLLTGDQRLACEATLCLSSGTRPSDCQPSLRRYFSINADNMSDTIKERRNFLKLCPSSSDNGMPALVNAIANGAGRCDAKKLNLIMARTKTVKQCHKVGLWGNEEVCKSVNIRYIERSKPVYCQAYEENELTFNVNQVYYKGNPEQGGHWVDK
jgi:hypothetical protein